MITINDAFVAAQIALNALSNNSQQYALFRDRYNENEFGYIIAWANIEIVRSLNAFDLSVGGNLPFFVSKKTAKVYRYSSFHYPDFEQWYHRNVKSDDDANIE
jgi:hypothetical protein